MIKLLVDGVFFQLNNTGIARVWRTVLELLAGDDRFQIYFLDRGNAPQISGVTYIPFPTFLVSNCPADSFLIQDVCDLHEIDVFTSTYYTTPINTPMLLMVYDMIPELFGFDLTHRIWMEKAVAISYAQQYLCISDNTRTDLLAIYPEIPPEQVTVAHCGVDPNVFRPRNAADIAAFKRSHTLDRPYFLFVGSRVQHGGYKNSRLFFDAVSSMPEAQFDVFCVGGEPVVERDIMDILPRGVKCRRVELSDDELALAYGGAMALVYPSLYEGFGMPVIEAMASGCPVITTHHGSLAEAAGDAALLIGGLSVHEMQVALRTMLSPSTRVAMCQRGLLHTEKFRWPDMAAQLSANLDHLVQDTRAGKFATFFPEWKRLRQIQADLDYTQ
jgi:glycosyltransferase involved in cell wall biosynthesis